MTHLRTSLALWACLAMAPLGAAAQDDSESQPQDSGDLVAPSEVAPGEADGLSMQEPGAAAPASDGEPQVGQPYVQAEFDDWQQRCVRTEDQQDPCQIYQILRDQSGNPVVEVSIVPLEQGQAAAGMTIISPLETLLTRQITIAVDGNEPRRYPFEFCVPQGCFSRIGLTQAEVDQFKRGAQAGLTIYPAGAPDQEIPLAISLAGFTAGFDATAEHNSQ